MVKVIVKGKTDISPSEREFNIEEGELVMVVTLFDKNDDDITSAKLGIFERFEKRRRSNQGDQIILRQCYELRGSEELGGQLLTLIVPSRYNADRCILRPSTELYVGKDDIISTLEKYAFIRPHTEWIRKLEKPYVTESFRESQEDTD